MRGEDVVVEEGVEETKQDKVESQRDLTPAFMAQCFCLCVYNARKTKRVMYERPPQRRGGGGRERALTDDMNKKKKKSISSAT